MPPKNKQPTHHIRYLGKRGLIAKCGFVIPKFEEWVGISVEPTCKKCKRLIRRL